MIHEAIQHRSGRAIAMARFVLATVFLVAIWADPSQPSRYPREAYLILAGYALLSGVYLVATWDNWWLEYQGSRIAHLVDIALFALMVFMTDGYTSPFFTFFVFIILSALIKWGWRETAAASIAVIVLYFAAGFAASTWHAARIEQVRIIVRGTNLIVLSGVLIWFAMNQQSRYRRQSLGLQIAPAVGGPPVETGLRLVARRFGAPRVLFLWWEKEEPFLHSASLRDGIVTEQRQRPDRFGDIVDPRLADSVFLFDARSGQVLLGRHEAVPLRLQVSEPVHPDLARGFDATRGLAFPVDSDSYGGIFLALDVPGLCSDDLEVAHRLGQEFSAVLQRSALLTMSEQAAESRIRLGVARDLHDSVAQLLAGTALRIEGLRKSLALGRPVDAELDALQQQLSGEQRDLRALIGQLRARPRAAPPAVLRDGLGATIERACRQWDADCQLERCPASLRVEAPLQHELSQLVKEAISNAVRHGQATKVWVCVDLVGEELTLAIRDNGSGFPVDTAPDEVTQPWSLNERVHELGGTLMLTSAPTGSEVTVSLPWQGAAA